MFHMCWTFFSDGYKKLKFIATQILTKMNNRSFEERKKSIRIEMDINYYAAKF